MKEPNKNFLTKTQTLEEEETEETDILDSESTESVDERDTKRKKPSSLWLIDAESATREQASFLKYITTTPSIQGYLEDNTDQWGISAVKGIGKTFLMQVKRRRISEKCFCLPPENKGSSAGWGMEEVFFEATQAQKKFSKFDPLVAMWKYSIICYTINHARSKYSLLNSISRVKLSDITYGYCTINSNRKLNNIINDLLTKKNWVSIINGDYFKLLSIASDLKDQLHEDYAVVFIDKLDQSLTAIKAQEPKKCSECDNGWYYSLCNNPKKSEEYCGSTELEYYCQDREKCCYGCERYLSVYSNEFLRVITRKSGERYSFVNIWQYIQLSLLVAAYQMKKEYDSKIRVYFSIREEAINCQYNILGDDRQKVASMLLSLSSHHHPCATPKFLNGIDCLS